MGQNRLMRLLRDLKSLHFDYCLILSLFVYLFVHSFGPQSKSCNLIQVKNILGRKVLKTSLGYVMG